MAEPTELSYIADVIKGLFPWLARIGFTPGTGGKLSIRAAAEGIVIDALEAIAIGASAKAVQLAGGGPAALRVGDVRGLVFDPGVPSTTAPALYYTADGGLTFVVVAMVGPGTTVGGTVPPPPSTPYTQLAPTGSGKVQIG